MIRLGIALMAVLGLCGFMFWSSTGTSPPVTPSACGNFFSATNGNWFSATNGNSFNQGC